MEMMRYRLNSNAIVSFIQRHVSDDIDDTKEYVFDIGLAADETVVGSVISNNQLLLHDAHTLQQLSSVHAHQRPINVVKFAATSPSICYTAGDDGMVHQWDSRCMQQPSLTFEHQAEIAAIAIGMNDTLIAVGCEASVVFYDVRRGGSQQSVNGFLQQQQHSRGNSSLRLGEYADTHSDLITALNFSSTQSSILASAGEDGLLCVYNTSTAANDDAIISIMNTDNSVRSLGYFGPGREGIYTISNTETMSMWHYESAQRIAHFPTIRDVIAVDYLIDCVYQQNQETLYLVAGQFDGKGVVAKVEPTECVVVGYLENGHAGSIRCCQAFAGTSTDSLDYAHAPRLVTGGEDSRLCSWVPAANSMSSNGNHICSNSSSSNGSVFGSPDTTAAGNISATRFNARASSNSLRYNPY